MTFRRIGENPLFVPMWALFTDSFASLGPNDFMSFGVIRYIDIDKDKDKDIDMR